MTITKSFATYAEADQFVREYEQENGLKYIIWKIAKGFDQSLPDTLSSHRLRLPTEEIPFLHLRNGKSYRSCDLGGKAWRKRKGRQSKDYRLVPDDTASTSKAKRKSRVDPEREMPVCPAGVTIQSLTLFPQFEARMDMKKHERTALTSKVKQSFSPTMQYEGLFIVQIREDHSDHRKNAKLKIDDRVTDIMQGLVKKGYYGSQDLLAQLFKLVPKLTDNHNTSDKRFYPDIERIRKWIFGEIVRIRNLEREKGYVYDISDALERMKELEWETETQYLCEEVDELFGHHDVYECSRQKAILTAPDNDLRCKLDTDGVPYVILDTRQYECTFGIEYKHKFLDAFTPGQRKHMNKEGMMMCSARCTYREVALFPGYRIGDDLPKKHMRNQILKRLREDLMNRKAYFERVIAFAFPTVEEHTGHPVREANGHLYLDEGVKSEITDLVGEGVKSLSEMRRHLKMYLKHHFDDENMPGPNNKRYRPSNQTIMNLMYDAGIEPEDIVQDVNETIPYISRPSMYKDISTRLEERRRRNNDSAAVSLLSENDPNIETLIDSLDVFQTIQTSPSKTPGMSGVKHVSPSKTISMGNRPDPSQFSDVVFKKQSECQALVEELLQVTYEVSDLFKLRDLQFHLRKLVEMVRAGRLLCDVIPLKRKRPAPKDNPESEDTLTATPVSVDKGRTESAEEPPTKLVIMDHNEKVTEVDLPKGYDSSEIILYQETDETGEQLYLVDQKSLDEEKKVEVSTSTQLSEARLQAIRKKQRLREEARRDMIKIKCKKYFTNESIINELSLRIDMEPTNNAAIIIKNQEREEIKNQEKEQKRLEEIKAELNMMEIERRKKEFRTMMESFRLNSKPNEDNEKNKDAADGDSPNTNEQPEGTMDVTEDHIYSESNPELIDEDDGVEYIYPDVENDSSDDDSSGKKKQRKSSNKDRPTKKSSDSSKLDDSQVSSGISAKDFIEAHNTPKTKEASGTSDTIATTSEETPSSNTSTQSNTTPKQVSSFPKQNSSLSKNTPANQKTDPQSSDSKVSLNLKAGDTITFKPGTVNPFLNNLNTTGMVAINNVIYANTPMGLIPCMPMILGAQNQPILVNTPVLDAASRNSNDSQSTGSKAGMPVKQLLTATPAKLGPTVKQTNTGAVKQTTSTSGVKQTPNNSGVKRLSTPVISYSVNTTPARKQSVVASQTDESPESPISIQKVIEVVDEEGTETQSLDNANQESKAKRKILIVKDPSVLKNMGLKSTSIIEVKSLSKESNTVENGSQDEGVDDTIEDDVEDNTTNTIVNDPNTPNNAQSETEVTSESVVLTKVTGKSSQIQQPKVINDKANKEGTVQASDNAVVIKKVGNVSNLNIPAGTILKKLSNIASVIPNPPDRVIIKPVKSTKPATVSVDKTDEIPKGSGDQSTSKTTEIVNQKPTPTSSANEVPTTLGQIIQNTTKGVDKVIKSLSIPASNIQIINTERRITRTQTDLNSTHQSKESPKMRMPVVKVIVKKGTSALTNDSVTDSPKRSTRGIKLKFSSSGEKIN